ncbi:MAG: hypothetical protein HY673_04760 [Chloroflexi bacterium]|nr:hypothetical protein [Chloroflexota bacterium]
MGHYEFEKNKSNMVHIAPHVYEGYDVMDVRIYAKNKSGEWVPTQKGISINIDRVPDLIRGLEWALQQPCTELDSQPVDPLSRQAEVELANATYSLLKKHGVEVHWDMADQIVLKAPKMSKYNKWQIHYVLTVRKDLFEYKGDGCFKAI